MFNAAQLHLAINHFPVVGFVIGTLILIYSLIIKDPKILRFTLFFIFLIGLTSIPAFLSGEPAEEVIENLQGVSESIIETHEDAATIGLILCISTGIISLISLFLENRQSSLSKQFLLLTLFLCIATNGTMIWVSHLGGQIRHPEIRKSQTNDTPTQSNQETDKD